MEKLFPAITSFRIESSPESENLGETISDIIGRRLDPLEFRFSRTKIQIKPGICNCGPRSRSLRLSETF